MKQLQKLNFRKIGTSGWPWIIGRNLLMFLLFLAVIELFGSCRPTRSIQAMEQADTSSSSVSDLRITEAVSDSLRTRLHLDFDTLEITIPAHQTDTPGQIRIKAIKGSVSKESKSITQRERNAHRKDTMHTEAMQTHISEEKTATNSTAAARHILWSILPLLIIAGTAIYLCLRLYNKK